MVTAKSATIRRDTFGWIVETGNEFYRFRRIEVREKANEKMVELI